MIDEVVEHFRRYLLLPDPVAVQALLGGYIANLLPGDPVWMLLVGPPSSGKTEILNALSALDDIHLVSTFTEASLLSGSPTRRTDASGGLLRAFRPDVDFGTFGVLVFKDFTSFLSETSDTRSGLMAALREIFDGTWVRYLGVEGGKVLAWRGKAGLLGAVTETIDRHTAVIGSMGERFVFCRMPELGADQRVRQARRALDNRGAEAAMRAELAGVVKTFVAGLDLTRPAPDAPLDLAVFADFVTRCRSVVETEGPFRDIEVVPQPEAAGRLARVMSQLDHGLDVGGLDEAGRRRVLLHVGWSSLPKHRGQLVRLLVDEPGSGWDSSQLGDRLRLPAARVERDLDVLAAHGVVDRLSAPGRVIWHPSAWLDDRSGALGDMESGCRPSGVES